MSLLGPVLPICDYASIFLAERMVNFKAGSSVPRIGDTSAPSANSPMLLREIASIMR
jgi:hypothetical protein